ncbi:hypothetical protein [Burkholderia sp.]|uniref:hypothetical protein n=1 Tax=Burkholderia sp. TaxID=36773 RepID=UPI0025BE1401|nr:hypothetical protein [Burkholderia sp.]MBS6362443.1 hypothetical protein [Burkholderia sp.]
MRTVGLRTFEARRAVPKPVEFPSNDAAGAPATRVGVRHACRTGLSRRPRIRFSGLFPEIDIMRIDFKRKCAISVLFPIRK